MGNCISRRQTVDDIIETNNQTNENQDNSRINNLTQIPRNEITNNVRIRVYAYNRPEVDENTMLNFHRSLYVPQNSLNIAHALFFNNLINSMLENYSLHNIDINNFQQIKAKEENIKDQCSICLCNYNRNEDMVILPCNHTYHVSCLKEWFNNNNTCPLCKQEY